MLHSYDEIYTAKAQTSLAQMLRYAEEDMHIELNEFWDMFLISGVADLFGKGDFRFLVGMSRHMRGFQEASRYGFSPNEKDGQKEKALEKPELMRI